jgi:DNA-binding transcriptional regulator YhcF (GntR family)
MKDNEKKWNVYIKSNLNKGFTKDQIKQVLLQHNYPTELIDEEINKYNRRQDNKKKTIIVSVLLLIVCLLLFRPTLTGFATQDNSQLQTLADSETITINFNQEVGTVNDYFYGVNTHGNWGSIGSMVDTSGDGIADTASDYSWHRSKLTEANIKYIRADMNLNNLIFGIQSKDAEDWQNNSITLVGGTESINGYPFGWDFEIVGASSIGTISKSTDAHRGLYSVNITNTGTGTAFSNLDLMLPPNHEYNLSVWIKSSYNVSISLQREDTWSNACRTTSSGNNTWVQLTCVATITDDVSEGWRIVIETDQGEKLLWDDLNLQQDGVDYDAIPDLSNQKSLVQWASENNIKILFIASYMPEYLANITSDCISDTKTCPPLNHTEWSDNVIKYITEVTADGLYEDSVEIEIWNEPDLEYFWLSDISRTDPKRVQLYGQLYSATYDAIKSQYPNMKVGGPAVTGQDADSELILRNIVENYSFDFISYHKYLGQGGSPYYDSSLNSDMSWIQNICNDYSKSCPRILLDEWNVWDSSIKLNNENYWKMQLSLAYSYLLDNYPENISTAEYQWSESTSYDNAAVYPEYPQRWSMVSEPQLDNEIYASYNVTKDFSTYHGAGSTILQSTSTDSNIVVVASTNDSNSYLTIINKNTNPVNITIDIVGNDFNLLQNVKTNTNYSIINDSVSIEGITQYAVEHFELLNITINEQIEEIPEEEPEEDTPSGGGGGSSYTPPIIEENVSPKENIIVEDNFSINETTVSETSQNTIDVPIQENTKPIIEEQPQEPIIEQPTTIINKYWMYFAIFGLLFLITIIFFIKKGIPIKEDLEAYIKKMLDQGYEYNSIRRVLSKHYKQSEIDNHFHVLRRNNVTPSKIQKESKPFTKELEIYIEKQKEVGYTEKEIMKVLKLQGYRK